MADPSLESHIASSVAAALAEDVGDGDITAALVAPGATARAAVTVRESAVLCGRAWFDRVFADLDTRIRVDWSAADGEPIEAGQRVCTLSGPARPILTGERTALNFLQTLSGTATTTARYARAIAHTKCRILDTRKTIPGLRLAQKYAVRCGGGRNHRMGLYDAVLIKENHILSAGGVAEAVRRARARTPDAPVEVEVEDLGQARDALAAGADRLLLDNFTPARMREAVALRDGLGSEATLEASGGLEFDDIATVAETGVDFISVGALTKHLRATDYSMRFEFSGGDG